jgi:hypothetical protein
LHGQEASEGRVVVWSKKTGKVHKYRCHEVIVRAKRMRVNNQFTPEKCKMKLERKMPCPKL